MKCIIELEPFTFDEDIFPVLWQAKGFRTLFFDNYGVGKLTPLSDDSCIEHLQETGWMQNHDKEIYDHGRTDGTNDIAASISYARAAGYDDGYNDGYNAAQTGEYQRGLEDAWEAAKKLSIMTPEEAEKVFPGAEKYNRFNLGYSGVEAIKKLQDYMQKEKADQEIRVGDEVSFHYDDRPDTVMVVTDIYDQAGDLHICGMDARGMQYAGKLAKCWEKTGRHFDQVSKLLEAMKENDG